MGPPRDREKSLRGAAILKLSFVDKGIADQPGFRVVYFGTLKELGLTNSEVDAYIRAHRPALEEALRTRDAAAEPPARAPADAPAPADEDG